MAVIRDESHAAAAAVDEDGLHWEPLWDPRLAVALIGKRVLVGITDVAADGAVVGQRQFHGHAIRADRRAGIAVRLDGARAGEEIVLPPDTRAFRPAARGEYRLGHSGEVVADPDFLTTCAVRERDHPRDE
jgi:hypothetical protein